MDDLRARRMGDLHGAVGRTAVDDHDLVYAGKGSQHGRQILRLILGDEVRADSHGQMLMTAGKAGKQTEPQGD